MAEIENKTQRYPSDRISKEWSALQPFSPEAGITVSCRRGDRCDALSAIRYPIRAGCEWRTRPDQTLAWRARYRRFRYMTSPLMFRANHDAPLAIDGARMGRNLPPTAAFSVDCSSVEALALPAWGTSGFDGHCFVVDIDPRILTLNTTTFGLAGNAENRIAPDTMRKLRHAVKHLFAEAACGGRQLTGKARFPSGTVETVKRSEPSFALLVRQWALKRVLGCLSRYRSFVRACEIGF